MSLGLPFELQHRVFVAARRAKGLTQAQLAAQLGISRVWLAKVELGTYRPSLELFRTLCLALDVSADRALGLQKETS